MASWSSSAAKGEALVLFTTDAALTGHLVLSTLHTNDAPTAALRLLDLGVGPWLAATALDTVLAQRLVRRRCPDCPTDPTPCPSCQGTGYRGRIALHECLCVTPALREAISRSANLQTLHTLAREHGWTPWMTAGAHALAAGLTTEAELRTHGWTPEAAG